MQYFFHNALAHGIETFGKGKPKWFLSEDNIVKQTHHRAPRVLNFQIITPVACMELHRKKFQS